MEFSGIKYILMDVEGTISEISFVKEVMFPYSREKLPEFLEQNKGNPTVQNILKDTSLNELLSFIDKDVKHPSLKKLQGMIWKEAFENRAFRAPVYDEVLGCWKLWKSQGLKLGIYSSGSVTAQKMFFGHSVEGNLLEYLENHFDLDIGGKKDPKSYDKIAESLALPGQQILFLSDVPEELFAAQSANFQVAHILRPGTEASSLPSVANFTELKFQS